MKIFLILIFSVTFCFAYEQAKKGKVIELQGKLLGLGNDLVFRSNDGSKYLVQLFKTEKSQRIHIKKLKDQELVIKVRVVENKKGKVIKEFIEVKKIPDAN